MHYDFIAIPDAEGHELMVTMPPEPIYLEGDLIRLAQACVISRQPIKRECMGIEPTESFAQTLHWF